MMRQRVISFTRRFALKQAASCGTTPHASVSTSRRRLAHMARPLFFLSCSDGSRPMLNMGFYAGRKSACLMSRRGFADLPEVSTIVMPALSPTMTHGTISEWTKKPGDVCEAGDVLCEIETDKAVVAFDVQDECVLAKILEEAKGREIQVGMPVALSVEDKAAYEAFVEADKAGKIATPSTEALPSPTASSTSPPAPSLPASPPPSPPTPTAHLGDFALSPAARHLLHSRQLTLSAEVHGTGKGGRLTKGDVIQAIANGQAQAAAFAAVPPPPPGLDPAQVGIPTIQAGPGTFSDTKNSNMRKVIARRLAESKATVPHAYETVDCEIDAVLSFRKQMQRDFEVNVSVNDFIIRSAALALRDVPEANAFWDGPKGTAVLKEDVDISVAVATPAGLITPIISGSDRRRLSEISATMKDLAGRARQGKLKPEEFQGGSFTISNLGMFGIDEFSAVINPPQAAIMAVGRGAKRVRAPPYLPDQHAGNLKPYTATVMTATLSFDRRVLDEALAAQFLQAFKSYMSRPELLLL
ncbi:pyruvate dehydrogenase component x [Nannochloropsis gaditana]|uniref:Dihydrolipoamide acetyltransferase component of pyruvate dehydrogenase complex n=1 Tax=Nannochloropsis gaditana TaxID=72520 RepID=W7TN15_9STRA|nr:pyruvate dehydrogenase component x [Nannochloropsis gaditana]